MTKTRKAILTVALVLLMTSLGLYGWRYGGTPEPGIGAAASAESMPEAAQKLVTVAETALRDATVKHITLSDSGSSAGTPGVMIRDRQLTIATPGVYRVSGSLTEGQLAVDTDGTVILVLDDAEISNSADACLCVTDAAHVLLYLPEGSSSRFVSGTEREITAEKDHAEPEDTELAEHAESTEGAEQTDHAENADGAGNREDTEKEENAEAEAASGAAVYARDSLSIAGNGSLTVGGYRNNAIATTDHLIILGGKLELTAVNNGLKGKDSVTVLDGEISIRSGNDGIKAGKETEGVPGNVEIRGGSIRIVCFGDGVQAEGDLSVSGGDITVQAGDITVVSSDQTASAFAAPSEMPDGGMGLPGGFGERQRPTEEGMPGDPGESNGNGIYETDGGGNGTAEVERSETRKEEIPADEEDPPENGAAAPANGTNPPTNGGMPTERKENTAQAAGNPPELPGTGAADGSVSEEQPTKAENPEQDRKAEEERPREGVPSGQPNGFLPDQKGGFSPRRMDGFSPDRTEGTGRPFAEGSFPERFDREEGVDAETGDSTKGLKSGGDLTVSGGSITVESEDDCIHADGVLTVNGGTLLLASADDGLHADGMLTVRDGSITVSRSYEGIEGRQIVLTGGNISVTASDDGINASDGNGGDFGGRSREEETEGTDPVELRISGGTLAVNAEGDGLDSNGDLIVEGGTIIVDGPTNGGNGALDSGTENGGSILCRGGTILAIGASRMAETFGNGSTQCSLILTLPEYAQAGADIVIRNEAGEALFEHTAAKQFDSVVFSSPGLAADEVCTVCIDGNEYSVSVSETDDSASVGGMSAGNGVPGRKE